METNYKPPPRVRIFFDFVRQQLWLPRGDELRGPPRPRIPARCECPVDGARGGG